MDSVEREEDGGCEGVGAQGEEVDAFIIRIVVDDHGNLVINRPLLI